MTDAMPPAISSSDQFSAFVHAADWSAAIHSDFPSLAPRDLTSARERAARSVFAGVLPKTRIMLSFAGIITERESFCGKTRLLEWSALVSGGGSSRLHSSRDYAKLPAGKRRGSSRAFNWTLLRNRGGCYLSLRAATVIQIMGITMSVQRSVLPHDTFGERKYEDSGRSRAKRDPRVRVLEIVLRQVAFIKNKRTRIRGKKHLYIRTIK